MSNKTAKIVLNLFCAVVLVFVTVMVVRWWPEKPFAQLQREDVAGITADYTLRLPEEYAREELPPEVVDEIVALMADVTVYTRRDDVPTGAPSGVFTLHLANGNSIDVAICSGRVSIGPNCAWAADKKASAAIEGIWTECLNAARESMEQ